MALNKFHKSTQSQSNDGAGHQASILKKAEAKILFIMCYYILLGAVALALFTYLEEDRVDSPEMLRTREQQFKCQSTGLEPGKDCGKGQQSFFSIFNVLSAVTTVLIGLLPVVVLAFTLKCTHTCTCRCKQ